MTEFIARTMMVDQASGKHVKRIDERSIADFFDLIHEAKSKKVLRVLDFSHLISSINQSTTQLLADHSDKELRVMHSTVYNMWTKAKVVSVQSVKEKLNVEVLTKSEEILNIIHERLPSYERGYTNPEPSFQGGQVTNYDTDQGLCKLLAEVRVFTEVVLCHIHSSVLLDPLLLREPSIYQHCATIKTKLREWLLRESGIRLDHYNTDKYRIDNDSLIYQLCAEDNFVFCADFMLPYLELSDFRNKSDVNNRIFSKILSRRGDRYDFNYIEWPKADPSKLSRANMILKSLKQIDSILKLFHAAKNNDVKYNSSEDALLEIQELIHNPNTKQGAQE